MKTTNSLVLAISLFICAAENILNIGIKNLIPDENNNCFQNNATGRSYEEALCYDLNFLHSEIDKTEIPKMESLIQLFSDSLKSYIDVTKFNSIAFENETPELEQKRDQITSTANLISAFGKISKPLLFTMSEFQNMLDSTEYLKCYNVSNLPGHDLIYEVIEMNIMIFALQYSSGNIDSGLSNPEENIEVFRKRLLFLVRKFLELSDTPYFLKLFFQEQALRADARLEVLLASLSKYSG